MGPSGNVVISEVLALLDKELRDYYGALQEINMGLQRKMPPRPQALVEYERCKDLNLPLVAGGVLDQPYIWLQKVAVILEVKSFYEMLDKRRQEEKEVAKQYNQGQRI